MTHLTALGLAAAVVASVVAMSAASAQAPVPSDKAAVAITEEAGDLSASKLVGASVYTSDNERIGEVEDLIIASNGSVSAVVMGVGGFLGLGEKKVAMPFSAVRAAKGDNNTLKIVIEGTAEGLKALPSFAYASS